MNRSPKGLFSRIVFTVVTLSLALFALLPFYIVLLFALDDPASPDGGAVGFLPELHFGNFSSAWVVSGIGPAILNSLFITAGAVLLVVVLASAAGFSIARFPNPMNRLILMIFLVCMMIPGIINTVPLYSLMRAIGGINRRWSMILLLAANTLPFSVFLYAGFVRAMPKDVEEAAIIDGCSWTSAFFRVTFVFLQPVTAAVIILNGLGIWNNYGQAVFFLQKAEVRTIPLSISMFFQQYGAHWNLMAAAAVIGVCPAVTAFLAFQKYFIRGIASGAVKG